MTRLPQLSGQKIIKILEKVGYKVVRQKGSHIRMNHFSKKSVTIPNHKIISKGLLRKILNTAEITQDEIFALLKK